MLCRTDPSGSNPRSFTKKQAEKHEASLPVFGSNMQKKIFRREPHTKDIEKPAVRDMLTAGVVTHRGFEPRTP